MCIVGACLMQVVVDALIKANKDFDLLMIPGAGHGFGEASNYMSTLCCYHPSHI